VGIFVPTIPYLADNLGASPHFHGALGTFFNICQLIGAPLMGKISDKFGRKVALCINFFGTIISYISLYFASSLPLFFIA